MVGRGHPTGGEPIRPVPAIAAESRGIPNERGIEVRLEIPQKIAEALWKSRDYRDGSILQAT